MTASPQHDNLQGTPANAASPEPVRNMSDEQLRRFEEALKQGWKRPSLFISKPSAQDQPSELPRVLGSQLASSIRVWLSETFDDYCGLSPRHHAAKGLREFVDIPGTRQQLLEFFRAFAEAYIDLLIVRVEVALRTPLKTNPGISDVTCITMAGDWPKKTKKRLEAVAQLQKQSPEEGDLFCLHEFSGCTDEELADYLRLPVEPLREQLQDLRIIVRSADQLA